MSAAKEYVCHLKVRSYELDSFGHVNNAVYLNYLEAARGEYLRQVGLSFDDFQRWGAFPVVRRAELTFHAPLQSDEEIRIVGRLESLRRTGFRARQQIWKGATLVLEAILDLAFVNRSGRPMAVPEPFRERLLRDG